MTKCKITVWSRSKNPTSNPVGKSCGLKNGELFNEDLGTNVSHVQVVGIESFDDLEYEIDVNMHGGNAFMTSGVPQVIVVLLQLLKTPVGSTSQVTVLQSIGYVI